MHHRLLLVAALSLGLGACKGDGAAVPIDATANSQGIVATAAAPAASLQVETPAETPQAADILTTTPSPAIEGLQSLSIQARPGAYEPVFSQLKAGLPIRVNFTGSIKPTCTNTVVFPDLGIQEQLKGGEVTAIDLPAQKPGRIHFVCGMGMYHGAIEILP